MAGSLILLACFAMQDELLSGLKLDFTFIHAQLLQRKINITVGTRKTSQSKMRAAISRSVRLRMDRVPVAFSIPGRILDRLSQQMEFVYQTTFGFTHGPRAMKIPETARLIVRCDSVV
jgi:hypothetical protein